MGPNEDTVEVQFPTNGIDTSGEFGVQRPNTSPSAVNVRSCDPLQERMRGGSRHGLIKFIDDELPNSDAFVETFTSSANTEWTAPLNLVDTIKIECWGGGGGGGSGNAGGGDTKACGGGGGGEYARVDAFVGVAGTTYAMVVAADVGQDNDGNFSSFNSSTVIANGGLAGQTGTGAGTGFGGAGGTGGTGDFTFDGGPGGSGDTGTGGAGGGGSGGTDGAGIDGTDGQPAFFGGPGGAGGTGGGDGGAGATSDPGNESLSSSGVEPGGGGGGGAADAGATDPSYFGGGDGATGQVRITYRTASPMQHLAQLVTYNADFLGSSFEYYSPDFIPDPSTNNGGTIRNPGRDIPPGGAGDPPSRTRPLTNRRRIQAVAAPTSQVNGSNVTVTSTLTALPGSTAVGSVLVRMRTVPRGRDGDGDSVTTTGLGIGVFTVNEPTYEGLITYITQHQYVNATTGQPATVTGYTQVVWRPNYTLDLTSTDGTSFEIGSGSHPLVVTLTAAGASVANRRISLRTNPTGRPLDGTTRYTDGNGRIIYQIDSTEAESVTYTASLIPRTNSTATITDSVTVTWTYPSYVPTPTPPDPTPPVPVTPATTYEWIIDESIPAILPNTPWDGHTFFYILGFYINGVQSGQIRQFAHDYNEADCCIAAFAYRYVVSLNAGYIFATDVPENLLPTVTMNGSDCPTTRNQQEKVVWINANCQLPQ